jgi:hypothetical protein
MPAIAIAPTAPAPTAAAPAATTPTAATPTATPATAVSAPTSARLPFARLVDGKCPPIERFAIQLCDRRLRIFVVGELNERESARLTRHPIGNDADTDDLATTGGASLAERGFVSVIREISYVDASSHATTPGSSWLPLGVFPGTSEAVHGQTGLRAGAIPEP